MGKVTEYWREFYDCHSLYNYVNIKPSNQGYVARISGITDTHFSWEI